MSNAFPLAWPDGVPRAKYRNASKFKMVTVAECIKELRRQTGLLSASGLVISTNIPLRMDYEMSRMVCQFSCGAASAVATKLTLVEFPPEQIVIVNAFIKEEHKDNRRFLADCEQWFGHPITVAHDDKYGASTDEVWRRKRFIKGPRGAPCSGELKRRVLGLLAQPGDVNIVGFTREESDRFDDLCDHFPDVEWKAPLIERGIGKDDCLAIIERAGIELPMMYRLGYDNANCIGCPKGGQAYWQNIRGDFPERFVHVQAIQEDIGPGANFLRFRSGPRAGERMSLAELPPGRGDMTKEPSFSCSFFCVLAEQEIGEATSGER